MGAMDAAPAPGRRRATALLLLALFAASAGAIKIGPRPTKPPGVIVKYKSPRGAQPAIAGARPGSGGVPSQALDPALNLYRVQVPAGQTAAQAAAALARSSEVEYAYADAYIHIAGGVPSEEDWQSSSGDSGSGSSISGGIDSSSLGRQRSRRLAAAPAARRSPPPNLVRRKASSPPPYPVRRKATSPPPSPVRRRASSPPPTPVRRAASPPPRPRPPPPRPPPPSPVPRTTAAPPLVPNDPFYKDQWALGSLRASQAWGLAKPDSSSVVTCVVDTGVKWDHPDLAANLVAATPEFKAAHNDDNGHGTHVAGIIGAVGNNRRGVAGISPRARILPCKALDANGWGLISKVIECISLCRSRGAKVINTSFVMGELNVPLMEAIGNATQAGVFVSAAAGNSGDDTDVYPYYPGSFEFPGVVAVANVAQGDVLAPSSNFGARSVDLAAPGTDILSTWITTEVADDYYSVLTGTSMAAPYVSGAAALAIAASGGTLTNAQVAQYLAASSRPAPALRGKVVSGGIVNLEQLLKLVLAAKARADAAKKLALAAKARADAAKKQAAPAAKTA